MLRRFLYLALGLWLLTACNSYVSKKAPVSEETVTPASISYQFVNTKVLAPRCIECHSASGGDDGDVNLETYENVVSHLPEIAETVFIDESMPPKKAGGPLGAYEKSVLRMWIDAGAPREAGAAPAPVPTPTPDPETPPPPGPPEGTPPPQPTPLPTPEFVDPTWQDISKKIFEPKCISCHKPGEKAEEYPLSDMAYVVNPANLMVVAGNPEDSELYISVTRQDKRVMPPPKTGVTLSPQEIDAIRIWILNGAKD
ncbi:c-type cytochrome domain-containing protein [Bdellovibrio sp. HCB337]|uniref:c-type cytochrome domain-containing protein n=1 Tax=Bdellovibrio sp. HCB337 TaxID=3394358 RepID=UPI0039A50FE7